MYLYMSKITLYILFRKIPKAFVCATNYVIRKCGEEAGEVFSIGALPSFDPQDCLTAFEI